MLTSSLLTLALVALADKPTVQWDLTIELAASGGAVPDQVCLVTPRADEHLADPWFAGVALDVLVDSGVLDQDPRGGRVLERNAATYGSWADVELPEHSEAVRHAFEAMRPTDHDGRRCSEQQPRGCEPAWEFVPPQLPAKWSWVVVCSPAPVTPPAETSVVFLTVRAVELDRMFTPFVTDFDVFGGSIQVRFDSVRRRGELAAASFQASAGVVGGSFHRTAAVPSFGGRVQVPLRPRCRRQRFRLREDIDLAVSHDRSAALYEVSEADEPACSHVAPPGTAASDRASASPGVASRAACMLSPDELRRGVFEMQVPVGVEPKHHQLDVRFDAVDGPVAANGRLCASSSWTDGAETDVIELEPTQVMLRWQWPCFAETTTELPCPAARVDGASGCAVESSLGSNLCVYHCDTTRRDGQSVGWPVDVVVEHEALGMRWEYALDAVVSDIRGSFDSNERRFLVTRGPLDKAPDRPSDETPSRWPAWWQQRRGDEIHSVVIAQENTSATLELPDNDAPALGSIALAGAACRDELEYRYVAGRNLSRWYNRRDLKVQWPHAELPPPSRTAFPLMVAANVGTAIGVTPSRRGHVLLYLAGDVAYRGFATAEAQRRRPAWRLGVRYFAFYGRKEYQPLVPPGWEPRTEAVAVWRHGPAGYLSFRFDQRERASSLLGATITAGLAWTTPGARAEATGRIPIERPIPYPYIAPEFTVHYRNFRGGALLGILGPDPTFVHESDPRGEPTRSGRAPYGSGAWLFIMGISVGVEV